MSLSHDIKSRFGADRNAEACDLITDTYIPPHPDNAASICLEYVTKELGINVNIDPDASFEGRFKKTIDCKPFITLKRPPNDARARFTLAHEIGHYLIDKIVGSRSNELFRNPVCNDYENQSEEYFADMLAASILMPRKLLAENGTPALNFFNLRRGMSRFAVSREAYLRRYASLFEKNIVYITCIPKYFKDHCSHAVVDDGVRMTANSGYVSLRERAAFKESISFKDLDKSISQGVDMYFGKQSHHISGETSFELGLIPKVRVLAEDRWGSN